MNELNLNAFSQVFSFNCAIYCVTTFSYFIFKFQNIRIETLFFFFRKLVGDVGERVLRSTPDWSEAATNGDHLWVPTSVSGDFCYSGDLDCTVSIIRLLKRFSVYLMPVKY
mgnify:CR=1 FL=1